MGEAAPALELAENSPGSSFRFLRHGVPHDYVSWHFHPEFEIHQIISTSGKLFIGDAVHSFRPGSLFLIGPYTPHNFAGPVRPNVMIPERDLVVQFRKEWIEASAQLITEFRAFRPLIEEGIFGVEYGGSTPQIVYRLLNRLDSIDATERLICFIRIMDELQRCEHKNILGTTKYFIDTRTASLRKFNKVVDYIQAHIDEEISMETAAALTGMSYKMFSRWFIECTGIGFRKYVIKTKINKSCEYLFSTPLSIQEICFRVGFNNVSNYNRLFRQIIGATPSEFRHKSHETQGTTFLREDFADDMET
ncbi:MAG: AraC family transcriptional regulator [Bradyrhizobium sp.]|nr:AraC family transcriptional regulator [Bradyrhizobium sp.]